MVDRYEIPVSWPDPPFNVVLVEPQIPGNAGNIARLCAGTASPLHLVGPLGFKLTDANVKRAGLDYWDAVELHRYDDLDAFLEAHRSASLYCMSTRGRTNYCDAAFRPGDFLLFGSETHGLPDRLLEADPDRVLNIPMRLDRIRSVNLANAVGIVLYEGIRQIASSGRRL